MFGAFLSGSDPRFRVPPSVVFLDILPLYNPPLFVLIPLDRGIWIFGEKWINEGKFQFNRYLQYKFTALAVNKFMILTGSVQMVDQVRQR